MTNYSPTRAELMNKNFVPIVDQKKQIRWVLTIKPINQLLKNIVYRESHNTW
jgi:hypothetical protein